MSREKTTPASIEVEREAGVRDRREAAWARCLRERARLLGNVSELERRRLDLVESVSTRTGVRPGVLGVAYDVAMEVGLDPVLALEIVGCGVTVLELTTP
ncbi:MAG: hypothetical protein ACREMA_09295, partial [Longimicrobiales bacterium]